MENKFDVSKINVLNILKEQKDMNLKGNLYHNTQIMFAYNTNHIEGNKLTEQEQWAKLALIKEIAEKVWKDC